MESDNKREFWEDEQRATAIRRGRKPSSLKSILIFTAVAAATAVCIGYYVRALANEGDGNAVGQFAIFNAMMPTVFLVVTYWGFRLFGRFIQ